MAAPGPTVGDIERGFLRRWWWLFPLLGVLAAWLAARFGWWFVACDPSLVNRDWTRAWYLPYVLLVPAFGLLPAFWRLSLHLPLGGQRWAWLLALALVLAAECVVRQPAVQRTLWTATKSRSTGADDFFLREVANLRLRVLEDRADDPPRLIFAGTSQLIRGIDYVAMQRALPDCKVCPRSVAGMVPFRMVSAQDYLSVRRGDVVVMYLSEFDLGGVEGLESDWRRPTASRRGACDALAAMPAADRLSAWRSACDLLSASVCEIWRSRDASRAILLNLGGKPVLPPSQAMQLHVQDAQKAAYAQGLVAANYREANLRALERLLGAFTERGARVVAFEGQVNPAMATDASRQARLAARRDFTELFARHGGTFVTLPEQPETFAAADFSDGTHLNEAARNRFTSYAARWIGTFLSTQGN